jgi:hypothetical protein
MRLVLFRSLITNAHGRADASISVHKQIAKMASHENSYWQGIELCSSQVNETVLEFCRYHNLQVLCRVIPEDTDDACRRMDQLSSHLMKASADAAADAVRLVIMQQPFAPSFDDAAIQYLSQVLPMAAQFKEAHPTIGWSKGELNAHGKPLDRHVLGVCHRLQSLLLGTKASNDTSLSASAIMLRYFSSILDILPPTRLSWNIHSEGVFKYRIDGRLPLDMEPLIQSVDHFDFSTLSDATKVLQGNDSDELFHRQVWKWQRGVQVHETYASCYDLATAKILHTSFQQKYNIVS